MIIQQGSTNVTTYFKLVDPTTGAAQTALTMTDLDLTYVRDRSAAVQADATDLGSVTAAHSDHGAIEVDPTNCPGLYRVDWPDAAFASGADRVQLCVNAAAIDPAYLEARLVAFDPQNATDLGLTHLDAAVSTRSTFDPTSQTVTLAASHDVYHADIQLTIDGANSRDEYTVTWFKNGVRLTTAVTSPTIQVIDRADATDLIAPTALTAIGSTGSYKHDEPTNRLPAGQAGVAVVSATIDSAPRSFARVVSRDSTPG